MKTIGLIGGMSWESSLEYYRIINETVRDRLGGLHSAKILMYSVDFEEIGDLQYRGDWDNLAGVMIDAAKNLEKAGADFVMICTNTMHKLAEDVQENIKIPLLHIVDVTGEKIKDEGLKNIGLLGTRFTMEDDFYKRRLIDNFGLNVITPDKEERQIVHDVIYNELCIGEIKESSRDKFIRIIENLVANGAEGIILGCTEIPLLVKQSYVKVRLFDTTAIHSIAAVDYALE